MIAKTVYVTLSQFCEKDDTPRLLLKEAGFIVKENTTGRRIKKEEMLAALAGADAVLAAVEPYDTEILSQLPQLKCISRCGMGTDAIDLQAAEKYGKTILVTVNEIIEPVAQMTLAMIFALARNFSQYVNHFQKGDWKKETGFLLSEWTIGLIGFGRIARKLEQYLRPFGCHVLVVDPFLKQGDLPEGVRLCSLQELLQNSSLVSLHAGRSPNEGVLLGSAEFEQMKKGSFLVNTARGYLVDEVALEKVLTSGHLAGAALDVFHQEPYLGPLGKMPNVLCTSHVATLTNASRAAMELACAKNVVDFFTKLER